MRQQVSNGKYGIARVFTNADIYDGTIGLHDGTMERKGIVSHWYFLIPP